MLKSAIWDFGGKIFNQVIAFVVTIVLARLLTPHEFGLVGIALALATYSTLFLDMGFKNSIIHTKDQSSQLYSTVLIVNVGLSLLISLILFFGADLIARFYKEPDIKIVVQSITLLFILNAATLLPSALNLKFFRFKQLAIISVISSVFSGITAIWMAYEGYGIWSLLARNIINAFFTCVLNWVICKWKPIWDFNINALKSIKSYSRHMFTTTALEFFFLRLDVLVIGKVYNTSTVGYYTRAQSLDSITRELASGSIYSILFPYFSKIQSETEKVKEVYRMSLHIVAFSLLAVSGILYLNAENLFIMLFTKNWLPAADIYKILTILGFLFCMNMIVNVLLSGIGKSKEFLHLEIMKKLMISVAFIFGFFGELSVFLYLLLIAYTAGIILSMYYVKKIIGFEVIKQVSILVSYFVPFVLAILITMPLLSINFYAPIIHISVVALVYLLLYLLINRLMKNVALVFFQEQITFYWTKWRGTKNFK